MNYDEMSAGREMDALVAEKIMGWIWWAHNGRKILAEPTVTNFGGGEKDGWSKVISTEEPYSELGAFMPHYSTDIAAAWEIVEHLKSQSWQGIVEVQSLTLYRARFVFSGMAVDPRKTFYAVAESAPLAICQAALKAVTNGV